jgi:HD-GYP domain-containing protein (c-di-GMP phosphodiesterase class II)
MSAQSPILQSIQTQFKDLYALLSVAQTVPVGVGEMLSRVSQVVQSLEEKVNVVFELNQSQLGAFMGVGRVINSSLGLKQVLEEVMDRLVHLMQAERGFLLLKDEGGELKIETARGMEHESIQEVFSLSRTIIRTVTDTGRPILTTNAQSDPRFEQQLSVAAFQLRSILCAPLKLKDDLIGVIYVDHRGMPGMFRESDMGLISAFADQAAVAIDNARLFERLVAANEELEVAYDATLNGWVRALDLRDKETEGHTQRVTSLTVQLARYMGMNEGELIHIQRGALLHDIGKMAIPDAILLKPGDLTAEERGLIRRHPLFAYEMLKPIRFLHPAIDIPYCHHEKWDGSGYPRGLKEVQIPLSARIFSVVDVYDALTSNRPYRKSIEPEKVREYLREQAGIHFDAQVVDAFLRMPLLG